MTHAAQASRGKGIQLLRRCVEDSSKRCKSKRYVCTANWSLKKASLLGNSLCMNEALQKNLEGLSGNIVVHSLFLPF